MLPSLFSGMLSNVIKFDTKILVEFLRCAKSQNKKNGHDLRGMRMDPIIFVFDLALAELDFGLSWG